MEDVDFVVDGVVCGVVGVSEDEVVGGGSGVDEEVVGGGGVGEEVLIDDELSSACLRSTCLRA